MPRNARCVLPGIPYHITQRGTNRQIVFHSAADRRVAPRYVEQNPVRALLAGAPEEYEWSSARAHLRGEADRARVLDHDFWHRAGGAETWRQMHGAAEDGPAIRLLRRCTYAGRPFGGEEFLAQIEARLGRKWRRWGFEKAQQASAA